VTIAVDQHDNMMAEPESNVAKMMTEVRKVLVHTCQVCYRVRCNVLFARKLCSNASFYPSSDCRMNQYNNGIDEWYWSNVELSVLCRIDLATAKSS
jgi:pyruvate formate-lyase activating enzyme-like uncharacterized protein